MLAALDPDLFDGIDFELRVVEGRPAQALIEVARHCRAAEIVIGTRRAPSRLGQRTIRSELEAGPVRSWPWSVRPSREPSTGRADRRHSPSELRLVPSQRPTLVLGRATSADLVTSNRPAQGRAGGRVSHRPQRHCHDRCIAMIVIGIDDRPSARDGLTLGRWLATAESRNCCLAWVHPYDRLPSLLDQGDDVEAVRAAIEAMAADVKATLPSELRSELRLVSGGSAAEGLQRLPSGNRHR